MKKAIATILISVLALALQAQDSARVVRVIDGDTYVLQTAQKTFTARLANVDAPELKQHWGTTARSRMILMLLGKYVRYDSTGTDRYKRTLVNIWVNGARLDSSAIRNGWAWHYTNYSYDAMLASCQTSAINERVGLWACGAAAVCPPWLFRHYNYRNKLKYCQGCNL